MLSLGEKLYRESLDPSEDFETVHIQKIVKDMFIPFSLIVENAFEDEAKLPRKGGPLPPLSRLKTKPVYINRGKKEECLSPLQIAFLTIRNMFGNLREGAQRENMVNGALGKKINENIIEENRYNLSDTIRIGAILNNLLVTSFPKWFVLEYDEASGSYHNPLTFFDKESKNKEYVVTPSEEFMDYCDEMIDAIAEIAVVIFPMVHPPCEWTPEGKDGGFYSERLKCNIVKHKKVSEPSGANSKIATCLNVIQGTPWQVNPFTLEVINGLKRSRPPTLKKVFPKKIDSNPPRPFPEDLQFSDMSDEQKKETQLWHRKLEKLKKDRQAKRSIDLATKASLQQAERFLAEQRLYFPHDADYRFRIYNKCMTGLNTQGNDIQKGLIRLANPRPVVTDAGVRWMRINLANLMGKDKLKLEERVQYVLDSEDLIREVVSRPRDVNLWHGWDKPVQGLAAALEYVKWLENPEEPLKIHAQLDGLCNGVQHLAAITRDHEVAPHVGLVPTNERGDVYGFVCEEVLRQIKDGGELAEEWITSQLMDRSLTKTPVMTRSYGAKLYGIKEGIQEYIDEAEMTQHFSNVFLAGNWMGERVWDSMTASLKGPMSFMDWVQTCAGILAKAGKPMRWTNPIGGNCIQSPFVDKKTRVEVRINNRRVDYKINVPTRKIDKSKAESSSSPNVIHSCDASHLAMTTNLAHERGVNEFAMVHDSFGCHPDDAPALLLSAKESWIDMYRTDWMRVWYEEWCAQLGSNDLPEPPPMGDLNIEDVMGSDFFFA